MEFKLPDLGEGIIEGQILCVHVVAGQSIAEDDLLMEVETDKAAVEIPSPCTGTVITVHVKDKQIVNVGDVMVTFDTKVQGEVQGDPTPAPSVPAISPPTTTPNKNGSTKVVRSSPSVRKLARTLSIDIASVVGSTTASRV